MNLHAFKQPATHHRQVRGPVHQSVQYRHHCRSPSTIGCGLKQWHRDDDANLLHLQCQVRRMALRHVPIFHPDTSRGSGRCAACVMNSALCSKLRAPARRAKREVIDLKGSRASQVIV